MNESYVVFQMPEISMSTLMDFFSYGQCQKSMY